MKNAVVVMCVALLIPCVTASQVKSHPELQKPIELSKIPKAVLIEFKREYPNAVIKWTKVETERGWNRYQLHTVEGKLIRDILYDPDGTPMEIRQSVPVSVLPQQVVAAINTGYPQGKITGVDLVRRDADLVYEVRVKAGRDSYRLTYRSNGSLLETEKI